MKGTEPFMTTQIKRPLPRHEARRVRGLPPPRRQLGDELSRRNSVVSVIRRLDASTAPTAGQLGGVGALPRDRAPLCLVATHQWYP